MQLVVQYLTKTAIKLPSGATTAEKLEGTSTGMDAELILSPFLLHLSHLSLLFHPRFIRRLPYSSFPSPFNVPVDWGNLIGCPRCPAKKGQSAAKVGGGDQIRGVVGRRRGGTASPIFSTGGTRPPTPTFLD